MARTFLKAMLPAMALAIGLGSASAASVQVLPGGCGTAKPQPGSNLLFTDPQGRLCLAPASGASGVSQGSASVTTANAFQQALAADPSREACVITNRSSGVEYVWLGAPSAASEASASSLAAGASMSCALGGTVWQGPVSFTAATAGYVLQTLTSD